MANKSQMVHYMNKYPGGRVDKTDSSMTVYNAGGEKCVHLEKDGMGNWNDRSEEYGCTDKHDLGALPRFARLHKLNKDGKISKVEEHAERSKHVKSFGGMKIPGASGYAEGKGFAEGAFTSDEAQKMEKYVAEKDEA